MVSPPKPSMSPPNCSSPPHGGAGLQVRYDIEKSGSACFGWIHENWIQDSDSGLDSLPNEDSVQNIEDSLFSMFKYMFWEDSS